MKEILLRLNDIEDLLKSIGIDDNDEVYLILKNRLRSKREGILFVLRSLGIEPIRHYSKGWILHMGAVDEN